MGQNLRYAFRALVQRPAFTAIVIATFALGIGANTAVFSVLDAVLLRPLPYQNPEQLVAIGPYDVRTGYTEWSSSSYPDFADWRAQNSEFARAAVYVNQHLTLTDGSNATHLQSEAVSAALFPLLGVQPSLGRAFTEQEDEPGHAVVLLSYHLWKNRFGGDPNVVGRNIVLDGKPYEVTGVMPEGFQYPISNIPIDAWTSISGLRESSDGSKPMTEQRGNDFLRCIARLKPESSLKRAQARQDTIAAALRAQYPDSNTNVGVKITPLTEAIVGDTRAALFMLAGMAGCVLLVACVNVANLLLARSLSRQKEISIRAALGAGRWHIVRQLLTESALLGIFGALAGLLIAVWGIDSLRGLLPSSIPRIGEISPDVRVLAFSAIVGVGVGILAGILPAWRSSNTNVASALNDAARGSSASGGRRTRAALVVVEIMLALVLLASAGLLVSSFLRLQKVQPGFDPTNVTTARVTLPDANYGKPEQAVTFTNNLLQSIRAYPGVRDASAAWWIPLSGSEITFDFDIQERPAPKGARPIAQVNVVAVDYFKTLRGPVLRGREFTVQDDLKGPQVAVVNEAFAKEYFPGQDVVGKRITVDGSALPGDPPVREIVGVVANTHLISLQAKPKPQIYIPHGQFPIQNLSLFIRTDGDPKRLNSALAGIVAKLDKDIPVFRARLMEDYVSSSVAQPRLNAILVALFAAIALLLAAAGIFGVMSYAVTQRTHEIGIRLALGAQRRDVWNLIFGEAMKLTAIGVLLGGICVFATHRLLAGLLYGLGASDHFSLLVMVTLLLGVVAIIACWWPARRASGVDPIIALRSE